MSYSKNLVYDFQKLLELYNKQPDICSNLFRLRLDWLKWYESSRGIYEVNIVSVKKILKKDCEIQKLNKRTMADNQMIISHHLSIRIYDNLQKVIASVRKQSGKFISAFLHILLKRYLSDKIIVCSDERHCMQQLINLFETSAASKFKARVLPTSLQEAKKIIWTIEKALKQRSESVNLNVLLKRKRTAELIKGSDRKLTTLLPQSGSTGCSPQIAVSGSLTSEMLHNGSEMFLEPPSGKEAADGLLKTNVSLLAAAFPPTLCAFPLKSHDSEFEGIATDSVTQQLFDDSVLNDGVMSVDSNLSEQNNNNNISLEHNLLIIDGISDTNDSNFIGDIANVQTVSVQSDLIISQFSQTQLLTDVDGDWRLFSNWDLETRISLDTCINDDCVEIIPTQHNNLMHKQQNLFNHHRLTLKNENKLHCCFNVIIQLLLSVTCVRDILFVDSATISEQLTMMRETIESKSLLLTKSQNKKFDCVFSIMVSLHELAARFFNSNNSNNKRRVPCEDGAKFISHLQHLSFQLGETLHTKQQHDASEILFFFHQNVVSSFDENNKLYFEEFANKFDRLFEFKLQYKAPPIYMPCCKSNSNNTLRSLIEYNINLKFTDAISNKQTSLFECLFAALNADDETLRCDNTKCALRGSALRSSSNKFITTPAVLLLILPRKDKITSKKINSTKITYPTNWSVEDVFQSTPSLHDPVIYRLTAVIDRTGLYNSGHYLINILDDSGTVMHKYNDNILTSCDFHGQSTVTSSTANILVYEKQLN